MNAPAAVMPAGYDVEAIRRDFPILQREIHGHPLVYLDNAASAQKPQAVIDAVTTAYGQEYANVHRGLHYLSNTATENYEEVRESARRFLNAGHVDEIIFTRNSTEAINLVAASFGGMAIGEGDEIVLSIMEHHSNIVPWNFHRERSGAVIRWAPVADDGTFLLDEFEKLLTDRTRIVAITHMSNVLGTEVPIREVCRIAHARGIPVFVDGSQAAVHLPVDVQDLDCDFYCFTGHKLYGPTGIGVLYGKSEHLKRMPPYMGGGEMIRDVTEDAVTYADPPHRFEAGTPPIVQAIGLGAAIRYVEGIGRGNIAAHEATLRDYAHERLARINSLTVYGTARGKGAIVAFNMAGAHPHDISTIIDRSGVAVRAGTHCAQPLLARYGVTATCRASFGLYNTLEEVDRLAEALQKAHRILRMSMAMEDRPTDTTTPAPAVADDGEAPRSAPLQATGSAIPPDELERLTEDIVQALKSVYDPEIPADIYELGLIYRVEVDDDRNIDIDMTLTAPGCPVAGEMPGWVENAVSLVPGVGNVTVNMVFDPPWTPDRMSDIAKVALDWY